jgi:hypothetical protein
MMLEDFAHVLSRFFRRTFEQFMDIGLVGFVLLRGK